MLLVLDNYDSFTYTSCSISASCSGIQVRRNDEVTLDQIRALSRKNAFSCHRGPCSPRESGLSNEVIRHVSGRKCPVFGVCLGHQWHRACVWRGGGGQLRMMHGKTSPIKHNGKDLVREHGRTRFWPRAIIRSSSSVTHWPGLPRKSPPKAMKGGEIMGVRPKELPIWGVQFHPERHPDRRTAADYEEFLKLK